jgi:FG-GAP-like repeat
MSLLAALSHAIPLSKRPQELSPASEILRKLRGLALVLVFTTAPAVSHAQSATPSLLPDFNGDGRADLQSRRGYGLLSLQLVSGSQLSPAEVVGTVGVDWTAVAAADFNGDGRADMLFRRSSDGMLSLYLMSGSQVVGSQLLGALGSSLISSGPKISTAMARPACCSAARATVCSCFIR